MRRQSLAIYAGLSIALSCPVAAQEVSSARVENSSEQGLIVPPSAPKAAQIEPMVAPVKRSAPKTPSIMTTGSIPEPSRQPTVRPADSAKADNGKSDKASEKTSGKSASCASNTKRAGRKDCVKVADEAATAKKPAKRK
jgi:hypothetical protein